MLKMKGLAFVFTVMISITAAASDQPAEIQLAVSLAKDMAAATISGDFDKLIGLTHPEAVELMGGKASAIEITKQSMRDLKNDGFAITEFGVKAPDQVVRKGKQIYVIIPTTYTMRSPKGKVQGGGFLLGSSDDRGATWVFADGNGLNDPTFRAKLFKNLPSEMVLPTINPPKIVD